MKQIITLWAAMFCLQAQAQRTTLTPGQMAPMFSLINVDDKPVAFSNYPAAKGFIVVFTCNTCPYSKAYEQRINALNTKYATAGYPVLAINPNSPVASPAESFAKMKEHAKAAAFNFPYLYDKGQNVTSAYGAKNTPHVFIVQKKGEGFVVQYTGAIDNDTPGNNPGKTRFVEDALEALLRNETPARAVTRAIGCSVKYAEE